MSMCRIKGTISGECELREYKFVLIVLPRSYFYLYNDFCKDIKNLHNLAQKVFKNSKDKTDILFAIFSPKK